MPSLSAARAINAAFSPSYTPVAIFVGGTSGVGQATAEAFAKYTKGNSNIILIGRNRTAAEQIISGFPKPTAPGVKHEFVQCDATLMKNVHTVTKDLTARYPKINFLVMSPGYMTTKGREETEEGIDKKLAVHYYARWKFTRDLLPALQKAKDASEDAKVLSILAPGKGGEINLDDLGLKKTFTTAAASLQGPTYNDLMVEEFASQNPDLTFIHAYPGIVRTNLISNSDSAVVRASGPLLMGLTYPFSTSMTDCGDYLLSAVLNNTKGAFRTGSRGEDLGKKRYFGSEAARKQLWEHTIEATNVD